MTHLQQQAAQLDCNEPHVIVLVRLRVMNTTCLQTLRTMKTFHNWKMMLLVFCQL